MRIVVCLVIAAAFLCHAQEATEVFIPIGRSPGLSREGLTTTGLVTVGPPRLVVGTNAFAVTARTAIYIDRSLVRRSNGYGTTNDLVLGAFVEVYAPTGGVARWVKVRRGG